MTLTLVLKLWNSKKCHVNPLGAEEQQSQIKKKKKGKTNLYNFTFSLPDFKKAQNQINLELIKCFLRYYYIFIQKCQNSIFTMELTATISSIIFWESTAKTSADFPFISFTHIKLSPYYKHPKPRPCYVCHAMPRYDFPTNHPRANPW